MAVVIGMRGDTAAPLGGRVQEAVTRVRPRGAGAKTAPQAARGGGRSRRRPSSPGRCQLGMGGDMGDVALFAPGFPAVAVESMDALWDFCGAAPGAVRLAGFEGSRAIDWERPRQPFRVTLGGATASGEAPVGAVGAIAMEVGSPAARFGARKALLVDVQGPPERPTFVFVVERADLLGPWPLTPTERAAAKMGISF